MPTGVSLEGKRVAVVGSGITGLSSAWLLHRNGAHVTLFERDASCGGHTLTDNTSPYPIDLGFQVYNLTTYPNLVGFFESLGVDTEPSDMSFALSMDGGKLEWASHDLDTIFAQRSNLASPSFLAMIRDVVRFGREAPKVLEPEQAHVYREMTLGQYLKQNGYSAGFVTHYVAPMCAAVWSVPNAQVLEFPVQMLVRFWVNHHLLDLTQRPMWRVVKGRSAEYVKKVTAELPDVRTSTGIASARRKGPGPFDGVTLTTETGYQEEFDAVVFATHSDVTMKILGEDMSAEERAVLAGIPYNENDVYLHTDETLMPVRRKAWASWNFLGSSDPTADTSAVCVSYWANRLQHLPASAPDMFVTLNPPQPPAKDKTIRHLKLAHPVFSFASVEAQGKVASLQGCRGTYFAGAWCGYGFHEDGIKAAVEAVKAMGGSIPWTCRTTSPKMSLSDRWFMSLFDKFMSASFTQGHLRIILPNGSELSYGSPDADCSPRCGKGEEWMGRPPLRATLRVYNMDFFRKVVVKLDVGMGEAYMDKDIEADDLGAFLAVVVANANRAEASRGALGVLNWIGDRLLYLAHKARANTLTGSRKNIEEHYDAGNAMYRTFLDETMTYSSGIHSPGGSLYEAQIAKLDAIIDRANLKAGDNVLEIGCGWGAFAIRAVQRTGCRITGLTLSKEQLAEANARVRAAGLEDSITFLFCDYRDCPGAGTYDKVVSIEMIEAVGHENLPTYFGTIGRMLKHGGKAVLQAISCPDDRYENYCACSDFIREHIFPGGHLPSVGAMVEAARGTGLSLHATTDIGPHYAVTLREWRQRWEERREEVLKLGYSERFWRKYRFYFVYCEAGFDARYIHNFHVEWVKDQQGAPVQASGVAAGADEVAAVSGAAVTQQQQQHYAFISGKALMQELPTDPVTQALLALYFFLAGMIIKGHPHMWLLPATFTGCALLSGALHAASHAALPFYRALSAERRAWWCADVVHLLFSAALSVASLGYVWREPAALKLAAPPQDLDTPSVIVCVSAGFFAFHLWLCVRYRLFTRTFQAIVQYTMLLMLFGIAGYKGLPATAFLAAMLSTEVYSVPYLASKLMHLAGIPPTAPSRQFMEQAEHVTLMIFRIVPHMGAMMSVLMHPAAFGGMPYYVMAAAGMFYNNAMNAHKARGLMAALNADEAPAVKQHAQ